MNENNDAYRRCSRCGNAFLETRLKVCENCGLILCPVCQLAHEDECLGKREYSLDIPAALYVCSKCHGLFYSHHLVMDKEYGRLFCVTCARNEHEI